MAKIPLWARFVAVGVILVVALVAGSNVFTSTPPTNAQRASALEATLKCPACEDLSVAQASSPSSLAVRQQVQRDIAKGMNDAEIVAQLRDQYGNSVLLTPPPGGLSVVLWIVPLLLVLGALVTVPLVMRARRNSKSAEIPVD